MKKHVRYRAVLLGLVVALLASLVLAPVPSSLEAASHRDAPLITEDPLADNTDVYAFVSPANPDKVVLIANYIPLEEPADGPNFFKFSDNVLYEIMIDTMGGPGEDRTFQFQFTTQVQNANTFLYATGEIGSLDDPDYNVRQVYSVTEVKGDRRRGSSMVLGTNLPTPPVNVGALTPNYAALAGSAIRTLPNGIRVLAGQRDEGFYIDLGIAFNLFQGRAPGVDSTKGFNVHTVALEVPKSYLMDAGAGRGIIGVWASASRRRVTVLNDGRSRSEGQWVQVSRLGNPLVNEVLIPLRYKDRYNATEPKDDTAIEDFIVNPRRLDPSLAEFIKSLIGCTAVADRADLKLALLTGIPKGIIPGFTNFTGPQSADMLRLNFTIAPSPNPNRLGLIGGDPAGFPNGRRVGDDVTDIALKVVGGVIQHLAGLPMCPAAGDLGDGVDANDVPYLTDFPFLGTPHAGLTREHQ